MEWHSPIQGWFTFWGLPGLPDPTWWAGGSCTRKSFAQLQLLCQVAKIWEPFQNSLIPWTPYGLTMTISSTQGCYWRLLKSFHWPRMQWCGHDGCASICPYNTSTLWATLVANLLPGMIQSADQLVGVHARFNYTMPSINSLEVCLLCKSICLLEWSSWRSELPLSNGFSKGSGDSVRLCGLLPFILSAFVIHAISTLYIPWTYFKSNL